MDVIKAQSFAIPYISASDIQILAVEMLKCVDKKKCVVITCTVNVQVSAQ